MDEDFFPTDADGFRPPHLSAYRLGFTVILRHNLWHITANNQNRTTKVLQSILKNQKRIANTSLKNKIDAAFEDPFVEVVVGNGKQASHRQDELMALTDALYKRSDGITKNLLTVEMKDLSADPRKFVTPLID
ncbi:unnamed protein product [Didymodactylos carnosus]|uniref:Uncharacterized protein n=1 Tax=Didymodactylos carnosus TaxID=1234261 RepID=A0A814VBD4_9BILA|nr:unnamed protein product [Didymodactylos carnosus]CAF1184618.1 unnamed protein product [Didymodactylos carnosus]CAF3783545.1 unnamed protein product [Didymodactylos carnosus]CAF3948919.1 unnamed protein product [Didymodactylos carnosus]